MRKIKIKIVGEKLEWKMTNSEQIINLIRQPLNDDFNAQMECEAIKHFLAE